MDTASGKCWRCLKVAKVWCTSCQLAQYCSSACAAEDRCDHADECNLASWGLGPCAYCGKQENHVYRCEHCGSAMYCSSSCLLMDDKNHKPTCVDIQNKMLSMARSIQNLRAETENDLTPCSRSVRSIAGWGWPALDILQASKNEWRLRRGCAAIKSFSALIFGGEFKHVLATIAGISPNPTSDLSTSVPGVDSDEILSMHVAENDPEILARLAVLVRLLEEPSMQPKDVIRIMYYCHLGRREHEVFLRAVHAVIEEIVEESKSPLKANKRSRFFDKGTRSGVYEVLKGWKELMTAKTVELQQLHVALSEQMKLLVGTDDGHTARLSDFLNALPTEAVRSGVMRFLLNKVYCDSEVRPVRVNPTLLTKNADSNLETSSEEMGKADSGLNYQFADDNLELIFEDWLPQKKLLGDDVDGTRIGELYEEMLEYLISTARRKVKSVRLIFLLYSFEETLLVMSGRQFDRILTGPEHSDRLGTPFLIHSCSNMINASNPKARLITFHSLWSQFLARRQNAGIEDGARCRLHPGKARMNGSVAWKDGCSGSPGDPPVPLFAVVAKIAGSYSEVLKQFLRAELLQYQSQYLGKKMTIGTIPRFGDVTRGQELQLVQIGEGETTIVPAKLRLKWREICNFDEDRIALEWIPHPEVTSARTERSSSNLSSYSDGKTSRPPPVSNRFFSLLPTSTKPPSLDPSAESPSRRLSLLSVSPTRHGPRQQSPSEDPGGLNRHSVDSRPPSARQGRRPESVSWTAAALGPTSASPSPTSRGSPRVGQLQGPSSPVFDFRTRREPKPGPDVADAKDAPGGSLYENLNHLPAADRLASRRWPSPTRRTSSSSGRVTGPENEMPSVTSVSSGGSVRSPNETRRRQPGVLSRSVLDIGPGAGSTSAGRNDGEDGEVPLRRSRLQRQQPLQVPPRPATVCLGQPDASTSAKRSSSADTRATSLLNPSPRSSSKDAPKIVGVRQKVTDL